MAKRKLPAALKAHQFKKGGKKGVMHSKQTSLTKGSGKVKPASVKSRGSRRGY